MVVCLFCRCPDFTLFWHVFIGLLAIHCLFLIVSDSLRFVPVPFQSSGVRNLRSALRVVLVGVVRLYCHLSLTWH